MHAVHDPRPIIISTSIGIGASQAVKYLLLIKPQQIFLNTNVQNFLPNYWTATDWRWQCRVREEELGYSKQVVETQRKTLEE